MCVSVHVCLCVCAVQMSGGGASRVVSWAVLPLRNPPPPWARAFVLAVLYFSVCAPNLMGGRNGSPTVLGIVGWLCRRNRDLPASTACVCALLGIFAPVCSVFLQCTDLVEAMDEAVALDGTLQIAWDAARSCFLAYDATAWLNLTESEQEEMANSRPLRRFLSTKARGLGELCPYLLL
jgi:hypothetical protein